VGGLMILNIKGHEVLIDEEDYLKLVGLIGALFIAKSGYCVVSIKGTRQLRPLHKLILSDPNTTVDHINGNKRDNRRSNLRSCTRHQNNTNMKKRFSPSYTSKYKGVSKNTGVNTYTARCGKIYLGSFKTQEEAAQAYNKAALELYGEFACVNTLNYYETTDLFLFKK
jgi:hypothetical protein